MSHVTQNKDSCDMSEQVMSHMCHTCHTCAPAYKNESYMFVSMCIQVRIYSGAKTFTNSKYAQIFHT